ncbi:MAG TPA: phosphodiester glycosidase family protein [Sphaerochaeta sp.]|nr:phosphodiester glycosidase family protein [Sphaerochaeta sp.]
MRNIIETVQHESGEIQRYQIVEGFDWNNVDFLFPGFDTRSISEIARLYAINIIPKHPELYGLIAFFHIPEDMDIACPMEEKDGRSFVKNVAASIYLNNQVKQGMIKWEGSFIVEDARASSLISQLEQNNLMRTVKGEKNDVWFIPINAKMGFLSNQEQEPCIVNSHFFLMDPTDIDSPYCELGTPYGLALKDGLILLPPLNHRPVLLVDKQGRTVVQHVELISLAVEIDGVHYIHNKNAHFYFRPEHRSTPVHTMTDIIITEDKVLAIRSGGGTTIPMAGFVISVEKSLDITDTKVTYHGLEEYGFGVQVGPSMMEDHKMVGYLNCPFYDKKKDKVPFPSTVYPLPFETARAARIAVGAKREGEPVLIWAEGAGKLKYKPKQDSTGCSLLELAKFCASQGYDDILNLDGGGSAQILWEGTRLMQISDRYDPSDLEAERPVPSALILR